MAHVAWASGGEADFVEAKDDRVLLQSTVAGAPGSRPSGRLADGREVRVKVHSCKRIEDGSAGGASVPGYAIEGRLIDATRETRETIAKLATPA